MDQRTMTRAGLGLVALAACPLTALAEEAADAGSEAGPSNPLQFEWVPFAASLIVFGVTFYILAKYVWPRLLGGLEEREKKIRQEIFRAEEARKKADEALQQYEEELAKARAEASKMIEATKAEQMRLAAELKSRNEAELSHMRESALTSIEAAKRAALNEIYQDAASLATEVAAKILQRELNEDDQRRLVDETLAQVESAKS